jgi:pimeloyl-ACP methyl ester carboxylesterase
MKLNQQTSGTVDVGDATIHFDVAGEEAAPSLLLLHGGLGFTEDFKGLIPALTESFRVVGIDCRGHGRSTLGDGGLTYARLEDDVLAVLGHLQIERTAILGFSDGGIVGYRLMASTAITVNKLIAIGAPCELKPDDPARAIYARITGEFWMEKFPASYETYQRQNPKPDFDRLVDSTVQMWLDSTPNGYASEIVDSLQGDVLLIRGDNDHLFPRQAAFDLANRISQSSLANIPFAGHAVHEDQPEIVLKCIMQFLQGQPRTNAGPNT